MKRTGFSSSFSPSAPPRLPLAQVVAQYLVFNHWGVCAVMILCGVMAVVLFAFFCYHLYLTAMNTTTNES